MKVAAKVARNQFELLLPRFFLTTESVMISSNDYSVERTASETKVTFDIRAFERDSGVQAQEASEKLL